MTCVCGHSRSDHIYDEGSCRPGFFCRCQSFTAVGSVCCHWCGLAGHVHQDRCPIRTDLYLLAQNIVNQLFDLAEVPVAKRQEINDRCDEFVIELLLSRYRQRHMEGMQ